MEGAALEQAQGGLWETLTSSSSSSCSIVAVPPLLPPPHHFPGQTWSHWRHSPPLTSSGFTHRQSAPWKSPSRGSLSTIPQPPPPPPPPPWLPAAAMKLPKTTLCPPAPTHTLVPCAAPVLTFARAGGRCPSRSARRVWKDFCRRRTASSLLGRREAEAGHRSHPQRTVHLVIQAQHGFHHTEPEDTTRP